MQQSTDKKFSITQFKLFLDLLVLALFIAVNIPQLTGLAGHEWVSFVFVAPFLVHLIMNWKWVVNVFARLFQKLPGETRFNQIWDLLLFIMMTLVVFSGTVVSEKALPALGIHIEIDPFWRSIHTGMANLLMLMFGVHLTMHWKWIVSNFRRYVLQKA
jgi:hypothetical protein